MSRARATSRGAWTEGRTLLAALTALLMLAVLAGVTVWALVGNSPRVQRVRLDGFRPSPRISRADHAQSGRG